MKVFIDNKLLRKLSDSHSKKEEIAFIESCVAAGILKDDQQMQVAFGWPSLLEYLDLGSIFETVPKFNIQNKLFALIISNLALDAEKEILIRLYDQIFVECLTEVKALDQIHPTFLLNQIKKKRQSHSVGIFALSLDHYERLLIENPYNTIHDLILYLAWDRVCINLAILFEQPELNIRKGLDVFKECALESFLHIAGQGRTIPSFFRLMEAIYAFKMRQDNLQSHTESEWLTLCQSSRALKDRNVLPDVYYIDAALIDVKSNTDRDLAKVFTMDSTEKVKAALSLADYMIEKFKMEVPGWHYALGPVEISFVSESESGLSVDTTIRN
jgi:hypothetical protein